VNPISSSSSQEAYLAAIVGSSEDAIIAKNLRGEITAWNRAAEGLFGYDAAEAIGRHISFLFPEGRLGEEEQIMGRISRGERVEHYETERLAKDGRLIPVSLTVSPILSADGAIIGASKIVRNISARLETEARLRLLQQELLHISRLSAMGQMASAIAHELNQPLSSAANYMSGVRRLLASDDVDTPMAQHGVDKAVEQIQRVGDIIRRLRSFVERNEVDRRIEDLPSVVQEAVHLLGPGLAGQCAISVSAGSGLRPVLIDRVQIQQVLLNLFRNAIEAMSDSPLCELKIAVAAEAESESVLVIVADTGPGISPRSPSACFSPLSAPRTTAWASACRSAGRSWRPTAGASGPIALPTAARSSPWRFPS
jgi:two-component system sensor kinase FixL